MLINEENIDEVIDTIRKMHQTIIDQRLIDLTEYLTEFFQSIQQEQSNLFRKLTRLLKDYEDRAALKIEFLKAQCLEKISQLLNDNEDHIVSILQFIIELLDQSENVQEKFLHFNGYQKIFNSLRYVHSPTLDFINQLILLMVEKSMLLNEDLLTPPIDSFVIFNNPHITVSLIHWIPYLTDISYQHHIISSIDKILLRSLQNKMMACSNGVVLALIEVLRNNEADNLKKLDEKTLLCIFSLLEHLSQFSINPEEIQYICQLFNQNTPFKRQLLQVLITAAKSNDPDTKLISSYFDLQRSDSGIILPVIRRWPFAPLSSSHHFSFHCWLRLNHEVHSYPLEGRRQIYSFYSDSYGLEAFLRNSSIFILITDHRELAYIEINECDDLINGDWHSLTIIHTVQRPSLFGSAFQRTVTCHLTVYIDGLLRKEIKDFKYISTVNDSINLSSIGSPSERPKASISKTKNESLSTTIAKTMQPLKHFFSLKSKSSISRKENQGIYSQHVIIIEPNSQDSFFGHSTCLYGQLASIWILAETLDEIQVKYLHAMGADFCHQYRSSISGDDTLISSTIFDYLFTRSLLAYHPLACHGQVCVDISGYSSLMNGRLNNGSCLRLRPFSQSLLNLGGCSILYPLIELFEDSDNFSSVTEYKESETFLSDINNSLNSNPVASIINLIRIVLSSPAILMLIEQVTKHYNIEILGEHLNHISSTFIDHQFLISIQQFIESSRLIYISHFLTNQLIEYILLDFNLWNKAKFPVRLAHLQYVFTVIKHEKKLDYEQFGLQYFLDILKQYFSSSKDDTDEQRQLRNAIYEILRYFSQSHLRIKELNSLLSSISTSNDVITHELLDFILSLLDSSLTTNELTNLFLSEPNLVEELYSLLIVNHLSSETKEIVLKIVKYFLLSKRVSQQIRAQLRLETNHIGFGGIISGMSLEELNVPIVQEILNLIISSNSSVAVHHLNVVLTLCSAASIEVRYTAIRKLMTYFLSHPSACRLYAKCYGWQETLTQFFVKTRRLSVTQSSNDFLSIDVKDQSLNSSEGSLNNTQMTPISEILSSPDDSSLQETLDVLQVSDIVTEINASSEQSPTSNSDLPSMENLINSKDSTSDNNRSSNDTIITPPESTSASREDLLSLLKTEHSNDDLIDMTTSSIDVLPPTTTRSSVGNIRHTKFFILPPVNIDDGGILEEMCETLILAIVMILWKGIVDSDDAAWMVRGQIFSALRHLHREYELYLPLEYIERRILELSMEACLNDIQLEGAQRGFNRLYRRRISLNGIRKHPPTYESNCRELIKLVNDFLSQSTDNHNRITETLVYGIIPILDTMIIFQKVNTNDQSSCDENWSETSLTGLNILLILLAHSDVSFCRQASVRIHSLLNFRSLNGKEEAAYLLSNVNKIISMTEQSEHRTYLFPLLKIIIEKSYDLLEINGKNTNIQLDEIKSTTLEEFLQYVSSINNEEWKMFIEQVTEPYADHYRSMSIRPFYMNMKIWWNNCQEMLNIGIHKRNKQIGTEKFKFQTHIVNPWYQRARLDEQRMLKLIEQHRIDHIHINHEWKNRKNYLYGERGLWLKDTNIKEHCWMLSNLENIHRMRCKLVENESLNKHEASSRLRDNLTIDLIVQSQDNILKETLTNEHLTVRRESLHRSSVDEQEFLIISSNTHLVDDKEKIIISTKCSLMTATSITDGEFMITDKYIYFFDSTPLKTCQNDLKYPLLWLQDIHLRRYNLRPSALEFFLINQTNFLLNFDKTLSPLDKKIRRQIYQKLMSLRLPSMKSVFSSLLTAITPQEILKESKMTEKWMAREISNFDYLMMLNTIAGRTYNDLNQYPIFPWILKDYTSQVLDFKNPDIFRDLSKPIGIQNPKHIDEIKFKYESFDDPSGLIEKFHYGTHYSNSASVMHYLIRMEPFTTLHIQLQSGKFDIADRQFHSFQSSWTNIMDSPNDGKELIPEFFYLPEFLTNLNHFDLGKLQSNDQHLNDVKLPPWANDSPEEFIRLHRLALESDYVSSHLHEWIDLIFGYKQTGQAAIDALNVFMYCSYERTMDADIMDDSIAREAIDGMIQNFGQIPAQILTEPHPLRQTPEQAGLHIELQGRSLNIFQSLPNIRAFFVNITPKDEKFCAPIIFISIPKNQVRSFIQQGTPDTLITINTNGVVGNNGWQPFDKSANNFFTFERDPTLPMERNRLTTAAPFAPSIEINSRLFAVSHDAKFIFSGGHWDWSLRIYSIVKSKAISSIIRHTDIITCLTLDSTGYILVTGSRDTTCVVWNLSFNDNRYNNDQDSSTVITPEVTLYGHTAEVTCVCVSTELDLVVSGSLDGTCNIHTIEHGAYIRTLRPTANNDPIVNLKISDERHILVQTEYGDTHLFLYSINGCLIRTRKFEYQVVDMLLHDQYIILAVNQILSSEKKSSTAAARIIFKDMFDMTTLQTIRLRTQINCLCLTKDFSHLLVGVKDGKLFVLIPEKRILTRNIIRN